MKKKFLINDLNLEVSELKALEDKVSFRYKDVLYEFDLISEENNEIFLRRGRKNIKTFLFNESEGLRCYVDGQDFEISKGLPTRNVNKSKTGLGNMNSPMPGKILQVLVSEGDSVNEGQPILVMEAMKMEHTIKANKDGKVTSLKFKEGDLVDGGVELAVIEGRKE